MSACTNCPYPDECGDRRACQRRAGAIEPVAMLPLSFEPAETLGDTYPAPLDALQARTQNGVQRFTAQAVRFAVAIAGGVTLFAYSLTLFGWA